MPALSSTAVRPLVESRPPGLTWRPAAAEGAGTRGRTTAQPPLDLEVSDPDVRGQPRPPRAGVEVTLMRSRWCMRQDPGLPDARVWSVSLAQALVETCHGLRPIAQLNRWVADDVLAEVALQRRRDRGALRRDALPPILRSLRLQHPHPRVAEVSVHVSVAGRSAAIAFRLEAGADRWLCTALDLGPRT